MISYTLGMAASAKRSKPASPPDLEVPLRVTILHPPAGVQFSLGRTDDGETHENKLSRGRALFFDLVLRARSGPGGKPLRMLGEHAHGTPSGRFIPIGVGTLAGQADSCWSRVIKISLTGITLRMVREVLATPDARLEVRIDGRDKCGGPACATVPLLDGGWRPVR